MNALRENAIVVVEDSEEDFTAFRRALKRSDIETKVVRYVDGESFLQALRAQQYPRQPALIVLDLNLPALGGAEILREMRDDERLKAIPVVILTTSADPRDIQRCYDLGIGGYLLKEGDFDGFCDKIKNLANYWFKAVHLP